jgi:hypothetical protein
MTVLSDELLANAECLYLMARGRGEGIHSVYHGEVEFLRLNQQEFPPEETTKWPI